MTSQPRITDCGPVPISRMTSLVRGSILAEHGDYQYSSIVWSS